MNFTLEQKLSTSLFITTSALYKAFDNRNITPTEDLTHRVIKLAEWRSELMVFKTILSNQTKARFVSFENLI